MGKVEVIFGILIYVDYFICLMGSVFNILWFINIGFYNFLEFFWGGLEGVEVNLMFLFKFNILRFYLFLVFGIYNLCVYEWWEIKGKKREREEREDGFEFIYIGNV